MSKPEELLSRWDDLNAEVKEFTCVSEILDYALHEGSEKDDRVTLNISGATAFIERYINDLSKRYTCLLKEIKSLLK